MHYTRPFLDTQTLAHTHKPHIIHAHIYTHTHNHTKHTPYMQTQTKFENNMKNPIIIVYVFYL